RPLVPFGQFHAARERVVLGYSVRLFALGIHVEAQDAAQQRGDVLAVAHGRVPLGDVVGGAAVTQAHVQVAVVAEQQLAAVVVPLRLVDLQQDTFGVRVE